MLTFLVTSDIIIDSDTKYTYIFGGFMPQLNLPKKLVSTVQLWASLLLIVLAFVFSMTPIITLKNIENADKISEMMQELDINVPIEEETEISSPKLISSISMIVKIVGAAMAEGEDQAEKSAELQEFLETDEGKESVATAICLAVAVVKTLDFENSKDVFSFVFNILISIIGLLSVLILTLIMPLIFGIMALVSLIKALKNIKTPENGAPALSNKLPGMLTLPLILMMFQCVIPGMTYASGVVAICVLAIVATVLNFLASRARKYPNEQFKYLNIAQGCSAIGIAGFLVFFFNIIRTGIFKAFVSGKYAAYLTSAIAAKDNGADVNNGYIIDGILMLVYLIIMLASVGYLENTARRFSCSMKRNQKSGLIGTILCLVTFIIPTYIAGAKHGYNNVTSTESTGDFSFLELTEAQEDKLNAALVGIIIMIVAEIAVIILKKIFCAKMKAEEISALMSGNAKSAEEALAEAQQIIADAEATVVANNATEENTKTEE